jgi:hypothetical protein
MDRDSVLRELRGQFGRKSVLYADDLAALLGKTEQALANLRHRGCLPFPIKKVGNRPAASIYDVADWLADESSDEDTKAKSKKTPAGPAPVPSPARHRASLGKALLALRTQRDFLEAVFTHLEEIYMNMGLKTHDTGKTGRKA